MATEAIEHWTNDYPEQQGVYLFRDPQWGVGFALWSRPQGTSTFVVMFDDRIQSYMLNQSECNGIQWGHRVKPDRLAFFMRSMRVIYGEAADLDRGVFGRMQCIKDISNRALDEMEIYDAG